jgi:hypothetical protein
LRLGVGRPLPLVHWVQVEGPELTEADRRTLWEQFVEVHAKSEESYDASVRTLAAGGVGVTASLATALHSLAGTGIAAVSLFLTSLLFNFVSNVTEQLDMHARIDCLRAAHRYEGAEGNRWTKATHALNWLAGAALIAGGALLAIFIASRT